MDAQISSLLRAAERLLHDRAAHAASACGAAPLARAPRRGQKAADFPSETLTCSSGFGIFSPPLHRGGKNPDL
jgi:hypothetical protein